MSFFSKFFSTQKTSVESVPNIQFGRYTDRNKTSEQLKHWEDSINHFTDKKYLDAYHSFFHYLKDSTIDNVKFTRESDKIVFELIQGSKLVKGYVSDKEVFAEADVVKFDEINVAVMRKLLSENYYLWFSKFAIKDDIYALKHNAPVVDEHPSALYFALKEMANVADSYDDVLVEEFPFLKPINVSHIQELPSKEKEIKLKYFRQWIESTIKRIDDLDPDYFSGARSFLLLTLTYKLYYLLAPEGGLLDSLRLIQHIYFMQDNKPVMEKNDSMIQEYKKLLTKTDEEISKSLYKVKATFAVVKPSHHNHVLDFIRDELEKTKWYKENKHPDIVQAICEYIVAYSCFTFGMSPVFYEIFNVFWHVLNFNYFNELGFSENLCDIKTDKINQNIVSNRLQSIFDKAKSNYPKLSFIINNIDYRTKTDFAFSFLNELSNCNFDE